MDMYGLTDDDRDRITKYAKKTYLDRSPDDLCPDDLRQDEDE